MLRVIYKTKLGETDFEDFKEEIEALRFSRALFLQGIYNALIKRPDKNALVKEYKKIKQEKEQ